MDTRLLPNILDHFNSKRLQDLKLPAVISEYTFTMFYREFKSVVRELDRNNNKKLRRSDTEHHLTKS